MHVWNIYIMHEILYIQVPISNLKLFLCSLNIVSPPPACLNPSHPSKSSFPLKFGNWLLFSYPKIETLGEDN